MSIWHSRYLCTTAIRILSCVICLTLCLWDLDTKEWVTWRVELQNHGVSLRWLSVTSEITPWKCIKVCYLLVRERQFRYIGKCHVSILFIQLHLEETTVSGRDKSDAHKLRSWNKLIDLTENCSENKGACVEARPEKSPEMESRPQTFTLHQPFFNLGCWNQY